MIFSVLTLFPDMIRNAAGVSILGRALAESRFELDVVNIRDFAVNDYGKVDDQIYGGGTGMLLMAEPLYQAAKAQCAKYSEMPCHVIYLSPRGRKLDQQMVESLAGKSHLMLVCGHYEGVDERFLEATQAVEVSIGDYVLTGGELPALVLMDAVARRLPGVLPSADAFEDESHGAGLLAEPQYTRPAVWQERAVPPVLLSGHAANIAAWRKARQIETTIRRRPDLDGLRRLSEEDWRAAFDVLSKETDDG